ncbi:MAG: hypothetical protein V2I24_09325 [Halieaceae bacterium]|jgi:hypothetical protein|nr:hypothetical protein [Halieaceae bacterium]
MAYRSLYQTNFTGGEWSPRLRRRSDLARYVNACDTLENMIVRRQGGVVRRSGTVFIDTLRKQNGENRLVPFVVSQDQAYVLDFSTFGSFRAIYNQNDRDFLRTGASPTVYGAGAPWVTPKKLDNFKWAQSGDTMYITEPTFAPQRIRRLNETGPTAFDRDAFPFKNGPFLPLNDNGTELSFSALTGSGITVTASTAVFEAGHVGAFFLVLADDLSGLGSWTGNTAVSAGDRVLSDGKIYSADGSGTTGANAPQHTRGSQSDGAVNWTYRSSLYAILEITAVASATSATATVVSDSDIPDSAKSNDATEFWAEGAWSTVQGWPDAVAFYQQRVWFSKGQTLYSSVLGDFTDFNPYNEDGLIDFSTAITVTIDDDRTDPIKWLVPFVRLIIGTAIGEKLLGEQNQLDPFGPGNIKVDSAGFHGSRDFILPVRVNNSLLTVGRSGSRVYEMSEDILQRQVIAPDRAIFSDHLLESGAFEAAYAQTPDSLYVALPATGKPAVMTYEPLEEVYAWASWTLGGTDSFVESVVSIPAPDGLSDDLYMNVYRLVDGAGERTVEYVQRAFTEGDDQARWPFVDGAVIFEPGSPITTVTGLNHLEGETVQVVADGLFKGTAVVSGGQITVDGEPDVVVVGLPYTARVVPVTPDPGSNTGASQGHRQRAVRAHLLLYNTIACRVGMKGGSTFDLLELRKPDDPMGAQIEPRTRVFEKTLPESKWAQETLVEVRSEEPLPFALRGIVFDMVISDR